ncbi:MAG: hypothetical protein RL392_7 [Pseudomonadota bacterium]|jgi:hypothetical protein
MKTSIPISGLVTTSIHMYMAPDLLKPDVPTPNALPESLRDKLPQYDITI